MKAAHSASVRGVLKTKTRKKFINKEKERKRELSKITEMGRRVKNGVRCSTRNT